MIERRDILRFSLFALLPAGVHAAPGPACAISTPRLSAARIASDGTVDVEIDVTNAHAQPVSALVQFYVHDQVASVPRPLLSLAAVQPVMLRAGERRTLRVALGPEAFRLPGTAEKTIVEPGLFDIMAGTSRRNLQSATLEIV